MQGTCLEVRKNSASSTWYCAYFLDFNDGNVEVGFEDNLWPDSVFSPDCVRWPPPEDVELEPEVDQRVEVYHAATDDTPSSWSLGRITSEKHSFYFIDYSAGGSKEANTIVERDALRCIGGDKEFDASLLVRKLIPVHADLHDWIESEDSQGCIAHVRRTSRLLCARCVHENSTSPKILIVGEERAVTLGERLLVQIHLRSQLAMRRFNETKAQFLERLAEQQKWQIREVFPVEHSLIGKIVGKKGENIKLLRERYEVEIILPERPSEDVHRENSALITVVGQTADSVKRARAELEYVRVKVPVKRDQVGWILGKKGENLREISKKAELHYARFDDETSSLDIVGLQHQIEDAQLLIDAHCKYHEVYKTLDKDEDEIRKGFEELDIIEPGKSGRKGGKGGRDNGTGKGAGGAGKGSNDSNGDKEHAKGGGRRRGGKQDQS